MRLWECLDVKLDWIVDYSSIKLRITNSFSEKLSTGCNFLFADWCRGKDTSPWRQGHWFEPVVGSHSPLGPHYHWGMAHQKESNLQLVFSEAQLWSNRIEVEIMDIINNKGNYIALTVVFVALNCCNSIMNELLKLWNMTWTGIIRSGAHWPCQKFQL